MSHYFVHDRALVDAGANIGEGTKIWHFSHVANGAEIGAGCSLGQNVYVAGGARIGNGVKIQNNVSVYDGVTLEDHVFCGPSVVFTNVKAPRSALPKARASYERTEIGEGASLGANCTVLAGVRVGRWALVGAGAVVTRDIPDHGLVVGVPGRLSGWVCECGERLSIVSGQGSCASCGRRYALRSPRALVRED